MLILLRILKKQWKVKLPPMCSDVNYGMIDFEVCEFTEIARPKYCNETLLFKQKIHSLYTYI